MMPKVNRSFKQAGYLRKKVNT